MLYTNDRVSEDGNADHREETWEWNNRQHEEDEYDEAYRQELDRLRVMATAIRRLRPTCPVPLHLVAMVLAFVPVLFPEDDN